MLKYVLRTSGSVQNALRVSAFEIHVGNCRKTRLSRPESLIACVFLSVGLKFNAVFNLWLFVRTMHLNESGVIKISSDSTIATLVVQGETYSGPFWDCSTYLTFFVVSKLFTNISQYGRKCRVILKYDYRHGLCMLLLLRQFCIRFVALSLNVFLHYIFETAEIFLQMMIHCSYSVCVFIVCLNMTPNQLNKTTFRTGGHGHK